MAKKKQRKQTSASASKTDCPCQSCLAYKDCCQVYLSIENDLYPETAEQLMRSRYCAYVIKDTRYLLETWHPETRPKQLNLDDSPNQWIGLTIKSTHLGQKTDTTGQVHFVARFKINGKAHKLEEISEFKKINERWFYRSGKVD